MTDIFSFVPLYLYTLQINFQIEIERLVILCVCVYVWVFWKRLKYLNIILSLKVNFFEGKLL